MNQQVTLIKVFVASPSDVKSERQRVKSLIEELNRNICPSQNILLEFVGWESVVPNIGEAAQNSIDQQIGPFDIFIGIMWKRFGMPTSGADSGTEHEFRLAYQHREKFGKPRILFYFSLKPYSPKRSDEINQWSKVMDFKQELQDLGLIGNYKSLKDFENIIREHLTKIVLNWHMESTKKRMPSGFPVHGSIRELQNDIIKAGDSRETDKEGQLIEFAKSHESGAIRRSSIVALRKIGSMKARSVIISILKKEAENEKLRESAIKALVEIGDENTVKTLRRLTQSKTIASLGKEAAQKVLDRLKAKLAKTKKRKKSD